jgi:hypothetical protein
MQPAGVKLDWCLEREGLTAIVPGEVDDITETELDVVAAGAGG